jgi:hypothetical protein
LSLAVAVERVPQTGQGRALVVLVAFDQRLLLLVAVAH